MLSSIEALTTLDELEHMKTWNRCFIALARVKKNIQLTKRLSKDLQHNQVCDEYCGQENKQNRSKGPDLEKIMLKKSFFGGMQL